MPAISPLIRWNYLRPPGGAKQCDTYMAALEEKDSSMLVKLFESDETRLASCRPPLTGSTRMAMARSTRTSCWPWPAVSRADLEGGADADETSQSRELYGTMLEAALARAGMRTDEAVVLRRTRPSRSPRGAAARPRLCDQMTSKAVTEFRKPDTELFPAFAALDADNGVITREELSAR